MQQKQRRQRAAAIVLALAAAAAAWTAQGGSVGELDGRAAGQRRQIFSSEFALRAAIEETNLELRQLKRDFVRHMSDIYIGFRLHPSIGYARARDAKLHVATANILMAEQFAELLVARHIVQRRLLTGLKLALTKLLPMQTLVKLYERYDSFEWLRYQQQVDVRPKFPKATEADLAALYRLVGLRAQVRAAEDVMALGSDNMRRVLQVAQWFLVEGRDGDKARGDELRALASHARQVLVYYLDELVGWHARLHELYEGRLAEAGGALAAAMGAGGSREALVDFLDRLINNEALDIGLSAEAQRLELPPTMTAAMGRRLEARWVPGYVLENLQADRKLLLTNRKRVAHLIRVGGRAEDADLAGWAADVYTHICAHLAPL